MHGRPRPKKGLPVDPEKQEAKRQKVRQPVVGWLHNPPPPSPRAGVSSLPASNIGSSDITHWRGSQALLYGKLAHQVLDRRRQRRYDPESVELSARLLTLNPEVYTVWNYRCDASTSHMRYVIHAVCPRRTVTALKGGHAWSSDMPESSDCGRGSAPSTLILGGSLAPSGLLFWPSCCNKFTCNVR